MPNIKTGKRRDILVILEFVNDNRTKRNSCLLKLKRSQNQNRAGEMQ